MGEVRTNSQQFQRRLSPCLDKVLNDQLERAGGVILGFAPEVGQVGDRVVRLALAPVNSWYVQVAPVRL